MNTSLPHFLVAPDPGVYDSDDFVVVDFETTNLDFGSSRNKDNRIVLACWWDNSTQQFYNCYNDEYHQSQLLAAIEKADYIVAHNAKFELGWLTRCGLERGSVLVACTQIAEYVIAGNRKWQFGLDPCLERYGLGNKLKSVGTLVRIIGAEHVPVNRLIAYCEGDVLGTLGLWLRQREVLRQLALLPVFYSRCLLTPVLEDIESRGMCLDTARVRQVYSTYNRKLQQLLTEFDEFSGGVNVKSAPQMAEFMYETLKFKVPLDYRGQSMLTDKGQPSTDAEAIAGLVAKTPQQIRFKALRLEIAKYNEAVTKYLTKMVECVANGGILYANLNQTVARTHRLTSTGHNYSIQFQNMQREFKPLFTARNDGWLVVEDDQAQLEYRVAVDVARDVAGMEDIRNGVDSHSITADLIFHDEWGRVKDDKKSPERKALRTAAKAHTFKPLYGGQSGTPEQRKYYEFFLNKHEQIRNLQDNWIHQVLDEKQLRTVTGLVFYWPDTKITKTGYVTNTTPICNYPTQMLATADIVPIGLVFTWHRMKANGLRGFLVNTVHDSQIAEVPPEEVELYREIVVQSQERDVVEYIKKVYGYEMVVPLETESTVGKYWCDSPEWRREFLNEEV